MKLNSITARIMVTVLPVVVVATIVLTTISYNTSSRIIRDETEAKALAILDAESQAVEQTLGYGASLVKVLADYSTNASKTDFTSGRAIDFMFGIIPSNPQAAGGGIWFEPYQFWSDMKYYGPFIFMEDGKPVYTDEYSSGAIDYHSEDSHINGVNSDGNPVWSDIYVDPVSNVAMVTVTQPFYDSAGKFMGNTTVDMDLTDIKTMIENIKIGNTGKVFLVGQGGEYISHWDETKKTDMQIQNDPDPAMAELGRLMLSSESGTTTLVQNNSTYRVSYTTIKGVGWHMAAIVDEAELVAETNRMSALLIIVTIITLVIMIIVIIYLARYLRKNLDKIEVFSKIAASGKFDDRLEIETSDEFNLIAKHLNFMVESMDQMSRESADMLESSRKLIAEIAISAHEVSVGSQNIVGSAAVLVGDSANQADALNYITEETETMTAMTAENAAKTVDANALAGQILGVAQSGQAQMNKMLEAVQSISDSAGNISRVIKVIDDIAFQTNILALNAAVEAARAGQHGKGFAVVADEVRNLAAKSADAAKETEELISESVEKAKVGARIAGETSDSLNDIVNGINHSAEIIAEIAASTKKQADAVKNIADQIQGAHGIARKNAETAGESSESAKNMNAQSERLYDIVRQYDTTGQNS